MLFLITLLEEELENYKKSKKSSHFHRVIEELDKFDTERLWSYLYEEHTVALEALKGWVDSWHEEDLLSKEDAE